MSRELKGIAFPFRIGGRGKVVMSGQTVTGQQHIKESIEVLVGARSRERVMKPEFGLDDLAIFFEDLNESTKSMAVFEIKERLQLLEDTVTILGVDITERVQDDGIAHVIDITYEEVDSGEIGTVSTEY